MLGKRWHKVSLLPDVGIDSIKEAQRWPSISAAGYIFAKHTKKLFVLGPFLAQHFSL